ncbi:hypothetical protein ACHELQ_002042 [Vibrio fluvialis]
MGNPANGQHKKTGHNAENRNKNNGQQRRRLDSHEFALLRAKNEQIEMRFDTAEGRIYGHVVNFDKYSVVVRDKKTNLEIVIFKHGITSFTQSEHEKKAA